MSILVKNRRIFPLPQYFCPVPRRKEILGTGNQRWRSKMRMMEHSGRKEFWQ